MKPSSNTEYDVEDNQTPTNIYKTLVGAEDMTTKAPEMSTKHVLTTVDKHMHAFAPAEPDPVGPAKRLGLTSIDQHPRFASAGLPAPTQPVVPHLMSRSLSIVDNKKERNWRKERKEQWEGIIQFY